ncbi:MlaD family protein [Undibacterium sp. RuRC25W]|uniref:MlaD family protein n=1 Tax=Undibacterium sp. RuRC25W TaxID=3413047 RepID=UPI003BF3B905
MENRSHALIAGFFTIALVLLTSIFAIWLGRDKIQRIPYEIVTSSSVSGLNLQAAVRYKGIKVGNVTDINFNPKVPGQIMLRIDIIPTTPITTATFATLAYQGVTGIAFIQLDDDNQTGSILLAKNVNDDALPQIPLRPSLLQSLEQKSVAILNQTQELTQRINHLLDPQNPTSLLATIDHFSKAADQWGAVPEQIAPSLSKLPALMDQTQSTLKSVNNLSVDAGQFTQNLNQLSRQLQSSDGPIARFNNALDQISNSVTTETLPRIQTLTGEARSSLRLINRTTENLNERPQSILFGNLAPAPGPGEAGFVAPVSAPQ